MRTLVALALFGCTRSGADVAGTTSRDTCPSGEALLDGECVDDACVGTGWGDASDEAGAQWYVDDDQRNEGLGTATSPYGSITEALLAAAGAGGTVWIEAGAYEENLDLDETHGGLSLRGRCAELVTLLGGEDEPAIKVRIDEDDGLALAGLTVIGGDKGILLTSGRLTVGESTFEDNIRSALVATLGASTLKIQGVQTTNTTPAAGDSSAIAINVKSGASLEMEDVVITGAVGGAVQVSGSAATLSQVDVYDIEDIEDETTGAIVITDGATAALDDVVIHDIQNTGFAVQNDSLATAQDVTVDGALRRGVYVAGSASNLQFDNLAVLNTTATGPRDGAYGVVVKDGGTMEGNILQLVDNTVFSLDVEDEGSAVVADGFWITNHLPPFANQGLTGCAAIARDSATVSLSDGVLVTEEAYGVCSIEGASVMLDAALVATRIDTDDPTRYASVAVDEDSTLVVSRSVLSCSGAICATAIANDADHPAYLQITESTILPTDAEGVYAEGDGATVDVDHAEFVGPGEPVAAFDDKGLVRTGGVVYLQGATGQIVDTNLRGVAGVSLAAQGVGTHVVIDGVSVSDCMPDLGGDLGTGLSALAGAVVSANSFTVERCRAIGIIVGDEATLDGTDVTVRSIQRGSSAELAGGVVADEGGTITMDRLEVSDVEGPGLAAILAGKLTCRSCAVSDTTFAGVALADGTATFHDLSIEGITHDANGGSAGVGVYVLSSNATSGASLTLHDSSIDQTIYAAIYIVGPGAYLVRDSSLQAGTSIADKPFLGSGVIVQHAICGGTTPCLQMEGTRITGAAGAGVLLDASTASLTDNTWSGNRVDVQVQGCDSISMVFADDMGTDTKICPEDESSILPIEWSLFGESSTSIGGI